MSIVTGGMGGSSLVTRGWGERVTIVPYEAVGDLQAVIRKSFTLQAVIKRVKL